MYAIFDQINFNAVDFAETEQEAQQRTDEMNDESTQHGGSSTLYSYDYIPEPIYDDKD